VGVAFDPDGNLIVADTANARIRLVAVRTGRFYGQSMIAGDIYTIAGTGVRGSSGDGGPAARAKLDTPNSVWADQPGDVFIVDSLAGRVRVVAGRTATMFGQAMKAGDIYTVLGPGAVSAAKIYASAAAADAAGNLIVTEWDQVFVAAARSGTFYGQAMTAGHLYPLAGNGGFGQAGSGGPALQASLGGTGGVTVDRAGNVAFTASTAAGVVWVVAERTGTFYGQAMKAGDIYIVAGAGGEILGDGGPATSAEILPDSVASTPDGGLLVTDQYSYRLRGISP
jgi:sugar lactone lactonase YvrE